MKRKQLLLFLIGFAFYPLLEIAFRGHTHVSMAFAGGVCLCSIDFVCNQRLCRRKTWLRCIVGAALITLVELLAGVLVNLVLQLNVWNYQQMPFNLWGQVCLPFCLLWTLAALPAMGIGQLLEPSVFLKTPLLQRPHTDGTRSTRHIAKPVLLPVTPDGQR